MSERLMCGGNVILVEEFSITCHSCHCVIILLGNEVPCFVSHRSSSANTLKDSSEEGTSQPLPKPKDKVITVVTHGAFI